MAGDIRNYLFNKNERRVDQRTSKGIKEFIVSDIFKKKNEFINPVIVTFQNGELNQQHASKCKVKFISDLSNKTKVEVKTSSGHIFKDSSFYEKLQPNQFLAIRNRKTNKVKLIEVDHTVLINSALMRTLNLEQSNIDSESAVGNLNRTFGTKRVKNRLMQREKLNLSALPVADDLKKTVEDIEVENVSFNNTETESILHLLPPCHRESKILSDVYILNEMLSEAELRALKEEVANIMMEGNQFSPKEFSPFVVSCYSDVKNYEDNIKTKLAVLLFIETLIRFLKMPSKKLAVKKLVLCSFSTVIHEKLLNEFCIKTDNSVTRPLTMKDKSLCFIIALSLICCSYQVNLKLLAKSTSIHLNKLCRLAQVVGAVPLSKEEGIFILKLPLPALPKSKSKMKKK